MELTKLKNQWKKFKNQWKKLNQVFKQINCDSYWGLCWFYQHDLGCLIGLTHGAAMLSNEFIPVMTQGPIGKRLSRWLSEREGSASLSSQWQTEEPYPIQCLLCDGGQAPVIMKVKVWRHISCRFFPAPVIVKVYMWSWTAWDDANSSVM